MGRHEKGNSSGCSMDWNFVSSHTALGRRYGRGDMVVIELFISSGYLFWMVSFMTREKVGYGDGWVLLMIGLFIGFIRCFLVLLIGLAAESMILLVLLAFRKVHKDGEIPFVPFLLLGLGVVMCI